MEVIYPCGASAVGPSPLPNGCPIHGTACELVATLTARCEALETEAETERIRLAACTTAALGNTPERVAERIAPGHPYWSASYGDVCAAVDREMTLRGRCEALTEENTKLQQEKAGLLSTLKGAGDATIEAWKERDDLRARCEALTAERDKGNKHEADAWLQVEEWRIRCQHLEQAILDARPFVQEWFDAAPRDQHIFEVLKRMDAALASLLPPQEETPGTDENRVSFAAGYSTALDDVLKDRKP